jgi:CHAT domain-containing protein
LIVQPSADDGGLLSTTTLSTLPMPFDLVVLSACSSGEGLLLAGQALHGLVSTVLDAGARGVIATRWRLDDTAIVPHMQRLYTLLLEDGDVVTALHRTRVEAMRAGVSPAIWANLDYFGDPTLQVVLQARTTSAWSRFTGNVWGWIRSIGGAD